MTEYNRVFNKSIISNIHTEFCHKYGKEKGGHIYAQAGERLLTIISSVDDRGNTAIRHHLDQNLLPMISCYQVMQENGVPKDEARTFLVGVMHEHAQNAGSTFHRLSRLPFFYSLFCALCQTVMDRNYPNIGWDVHWLQKDEEKIAFDCRACVYRDTTALFGCPELCQHFCENDVLVYGTLQPKMSFIRTKTLAAGDDCCDFRFVNGKKYQ